MLLCFSLYSLLDLFRLVKLLFVRSNLLVQLMHAIFEEYVLSPQISNFDMSHTTVLYVVHTVSVRARLHIHYTGH
jgi:hypothetical protein